MHANRPDMLEIGVLSLHDNARPHLGKDVRELLDGYSWEVLPHPPYSPDMRPPDLYLFPKFKINMRGVLVSTLEELAASVTQRVRQLKCSRELMGIIDLPRHWDAVIRQKGTLTEGFPCVFLSCKTNVMVLLAKTGARPTLSKLDGEII
jgi:transposase